ncbi:MAG: ribonuclease H family protein [Bacteroidota bacterium]
MAKKQKFYVVWEGHEPGIYDSWQACQRQIKNYAGAKYKAFPSKAAAEEAFGSNYQDYIGNNATKAKPSKPKEIPASMLGEVNWESIAVDAACSGNPGVMEYQGVDTKTGQQLFHKKFSLGTNNIGEFLALVHALAQFKKEGKDTPIYTDSKIAMGWVRKKKCRTKLARTAKTAFLYQVIGRAEQWLQSNTYSNPILKWDTERWGEIPADFGRK